MSTATDAEAKPATKLPDRYGWARGGSYDHHEPGTSTRLTRLIAAYGDQLPSVESLIADIRADKVPPGHGEVPLTLADAFTVLTFMEPVDAKVAQLAIDVALRAKKATLLAVLDQECGGTSNFRRTLRAIMVRQPNFRMHFGDVAADIPVTLRDKFAAELDLAKL